MTPEIKDIIAKIADGLAEDKKGLISDLEIKIEAALDATRKEVSPPRPAEPDAGALAEKYQSDRGTRRTFTPNVAPSVPHPADYTDLLPRR
jgi:hypothetical protein